MQVDKETVLKALRAAPPTGLSAHELMVHLSADLKGRHRLRKLLAELVESGSIEKAPRGRYRLVGRQPATPAGELPANWVVGQLRVNPAGFGFVVREDGEVDAFVAARHRGYAMDGDRVALTTWIGYKGTEGRVEKVLARGRARLTGTYHQTGRRSYLEPDDPRIAATSGHVMLDEAGGAKEGQAVVAEITRYPAQPEEPLLARITHVLGAPGDLHTEIEKILICGEVPTDFPEEVVQAGARAPTEVGPADLADRADLRDRRFLTIDPETARDFDDAVCVEPSPKGEGWRRLWVAVADVSHYVRLDSALDHEARVRGCSVYLPDRAIPMLPRQLSAGICSLNPEVDRCAMVARMEIDGEGAVHDEYFCAAVIRSRARLDYAGVAAALAGDLRGPRARYREFLPELEQMAALAQTMRARRLERGALDFDLPEAKVVLDEDDPARVRDVVRARADPHVKGAYQLIEDFMLAANEAVARHFARLERDTIWRIHDVPADERLEKFAALAQSFGLRFDAASGRSPQKLRQFLATLSERPADDGVARALNQLLLRTLKQAVYDVVNVGHFGLAAPHYVHFTSPIRRYPDLIVHRLLKAALHHDGLPAGGPPPAPPPPELLQQLAVESSKAERRAMEAERAVVDLYRAVLMRDRVGEEFAGVISAVTTFGLFVQIESPFVEGLVKVTALGDDRYEFDEKTQRLVGQRSGRQFSLGDPVRVRVENVSVSQRKIDLQLLQHRESERPAAERPRRGDRRPKAEPRRGRAPERPKERKGGRKRRPKGR